MHPPRRVKSAEEDQAMVLLAAHRGCCSALSDDRDGSCPDAYGGPLIFRTTRLTGRKLGRRRGDTAGGDVHGLNAHKIVPAPDAFSVAEKAVRMPKPCPL